MFNIHTTNKKRHLNERRKVRRHNIYGRGIVFLFLSLLFVALNGCSKNKLSNEEVSLNTAIKASSGDASWTLNAPSEGLALGLTTDSEDLGEYVTLNVPYTLKNGAMTPDWIAITPPEGYPSARLCVYGPYVPTEEFSLRSVHEDPSSPIQYPPYSVVNLPYGIETDQRNKGTASSDLVWGEQEKYTGKKGDNVVLNHKFCKIKIKLTSELNNNLSEAKVTLVRMFQGGSLAFRDGQFKVSNNDDAFRADVTTFQNPDGTYEAIIPPQTIEPATDCIRVEVNTATYNFRLNTQKNLIAGTQYTFDLTVKDKGDLPFTIIVNYDKGKILGDQLNIPAQETVYDIGMNEIPLPGDVISGTPLRIRNSTGERCWARLYNTNTTIESRRDIIQDQVRYLTIQFEENLSPDPRSMILEFYNTILSKFVHKRVLIQQAAATRYIDLSSKSLSLDKWGNRYDTPESLTIRSDRGWTLENSSSDWVNVTGYTPLNRVQTLNITVSENNTGVQREGELRVVIDGATAATYKITQSSNEKPTFTLKYELNLTYSTTENKWHKYDERLGGDLYASKVFVFAKHEDSDAAAEITSTAPYGFVVDAPTSSNKLVVTGFRSNYFIHPNYNGTSGTISEVNSSVSGPPTQGSQNFFRQIIFDLPIPPNVKRNQMVKYTVVIDDVRDTKDHTPANVTATIINQ